MATQQERIRAEAYSPAILKLIAHLRDHFDNTAPNNFKIDVELKQEEKVLIDLQHLDEYYLIFRVENITKNL